MSSDSGTCLIGSSDACETPVVAAGPAVDRRWQKLRPGSVPSQKTATYHRLKNTKVEEVAGESP